MTDKLARIEGRLAACRDDVGNRPYSAPVSTGWYAEDVLALVNIAKAARPFAEPRDTTLAEYDALRAALAVLDGD